MNLLEYLVAMTVLRAVSLATAWVPVAHDRVVLATARTSVLEGNLAYLDAAIRAHDPTLKIVHLVHPYGYGLTAKVGYLFRLMRAMVELRRARLFIVDNAYLPVHVARHRSSTTVVQVWHAASALKRFGRDLPTTIGRVGGRFLHRHYDHVVASSEFARQPYAAAFGISPERIAVTGMPRADLFSDPAAMDAARTRVLARHPSLKDRTIVVYAPTFRGRGAAKVASTSLDGRRLRALLPAGHVLVLKAHPNLDPDLTPTDGFDVIVDHDTEINDLLTVTDILVTDYSSSIFEYALLHRPVILLVPDLEDYERLPGLYVDYRTAMVGVQVRDADGVAAAIKADRFDLSAYDAFIARHLGPADGKASLRFVERFIAPS